MPVVINDLDVAVEPAPTGATAPPPAATPVSVGHLDDVTRHLEARRSRVRAD